MAEVLVVGAGLSGLTAARALQDEGHDVVVVDKGRAPGGRMATRRLEGGVWDHGAQFLTAKSDDFDQQVGWWQDDGVAATWFHGSPDADEAGRPHDDPEDGHPRFRGAPYMRAIPEYLAEGLAVRCEVELTALAHQDGRWVALSTDGEHLAADGVVVTTPAPQALGLLDEVRVDDDVTDGLHAIDYHPCWAVLVVPEGDPDLPDHGILRFDDHPLHIVTDNHRKGLSPGPSVTLHASPERSRELLEQPGDVVGQQLLRDARRFVDGRVVHTHRWRYSMPTGPGPADALVTTSPGPLAVAGDGFAGGRVEGAWTSGRAAARLLAAHL